MNRLATLVAAFSLTLAAFATFFVLFYTGRPTTTVISDAARYALGPVGAGYAFYLAVTNSRGTLEGLRHYVLR